MFKAGHIPIHPRIRELFNLKVSISVDGEDTEAARKVMISFRDDPEPVKTFAAGMIVCEGITKCEEDALNHIFSKIKGGEQVDSLTFLITLEALQRFPRSMLEDEHVIALINATASKPGPGANMASLLISKLHALKYPPI